MRGTCVGPSNRYKREIQTAERSILLYPGPHSYFNNYFSTLTLIIKTVPHWINYLLKVYDSIGNCDCFSFASTTGENTMWVLLIIQIYEHGSGMAWHLLHKTPLKKKNSKWPKRGRCILHTPSKGTPMISLVVSYKRQEMYVQHNIEARMHLYILNRWSYNLIHWCHPFCSRRYSQFVHTLHNVTTVAVILLRETY